VLTDGLDLDSSGRCSDRHLSMLEALVRPLEQEVEMFLILVQTFDSLSSAMRLTTLDHHLGLSAEISQSPKPLSVREIGRPRTVSDTLPMSGVKGVASSNLASSTKTLNVSPQVAASLLGPVGAFDCHAEVVVLLFDQLHRVVELSDSDDAIPVADVAVIEHQIARRLVVADIADVRVVSFWHALHGQRPGKFRDLLNLVEILEGQGERELVSEVLCGGVVGQSCGEHGVAKADLDRRLT
jgi:hypothetical protein